MTKILFVDIPTYEVEIDRGYLEKLRVRLAAEEILRKSRTGIERVLQGSQDFTRGLLTMATYLEARGHEVGYFRYDYLNRVELMQAASKYPVVGITAMTPVIATAIELAGAIKQIDESKLVILGGYHATFMSEAILREHKCIDVIVRGEGEATLDQILRSLEHLDDIPGIAFRTKDGDIELNEQPPCLRGEDLPVPLYELLGTNLDSYRFNIPTARGCSYKCAFCANNPFWGNERYRSVSQVVDELDYLSTRLQPGTLIHFSDSIFTRNRNRARDICQRIVDRHYPFFFSCDIRGSYMDEELAKIMELAGVVQVSIGFEDANNHVLRKAGKGLRLEENVISAKIIKAKTRIHVNAYWIVTLPYSTRFSLEHNTQVVRELIRSGTVDTINSKLLVLYPGTPYFERPRAFGITILNRDWETYDRRLYPPIYRLSSLTEEDIYNYLLELEDVIIEEYCGKLGVSANELREYPLKTICRHTAARYVKPFA